MNYGTILQQQREQLTLSMDGYITRSVEPYLETLMETSHIKIVTGPRRSGKSTVCQKMIQGKRFGYCNFDDDRLLHAGFDSDALTQALTKDSPEILFFDEIQNVPQRELWINRLHRSGYNILITGSNASMLSQELSTHLTGRHFQIHIGTLSFRELYDHYQLNTTSTTNIQQCFKYVDLLLVQGGYPELYTKSFDAQLYINALVQDTITKDILFRYALRNSSEVQSLLLYLYQSITKEYSYRRISSYLPILSANTIKKYIGYLAQGFLVNELEYFSYSSSQRSVYHKKLYLHDNGLLFYNKFAHSLDLGKRLENLVYQYLHTKYESIFYYQDSNSKKECDFIVKEGLIISTCVQVCYELTTDNYKREVTGLIAAMKKFNCTVGYIVTYDQDHFDLIVDPSIAIVPIYSYLLS